MTLAAACLVNAVNILATLASLKARKIFTPDGKWSPLSFMKLTHEVNGDLTSTDFLPAQKRRLYWQQCPPVQWWRSIYRGMPFFFRKMNLLQLGPQSKAPCFYKQQVLSQVRTAGCASCMRLLKFNTYLTIHTSITRRFALNLRGKTFGNLLTSSSMFWSSLPTPFAFLSCRGVSRGYTQDG